MSSKFEKIIIYPKTEANQEFGVTNPEIKKESAILADKGNGNLAENLRIFETLEKIKVYTATDRGIGKEKNDDRVVINPHDSQFTVLDGMNSARASQILAEKILINSDNLDNALKEAKQEMKNNRIGDGTCLISAKLTPEKILKVSQIGDCGAMILDSDGEIKFSALNQVKERSTILDVNMKEFGIERTYQRLIDTSPASFVSSSSGKLYNYDDIQLASGDVVLLFSDALLSNFSQAEISQLVKQNKNPQNLFRTIAEELRRKMQSANNLFSGEKDKIFSSYKERAQCYYGGDYVPQSDNQSLILFQV